MPLEKTEQDKIIERETTFNNLWDRLMIALHPRNPSRFPLNDSQQKKIERYHLQKKSTEPLTLDQQLDVFTKLLPDLLKQFIKRIGPRTPEEKKQQERYENINEDKKYLEGFLIQFDDFTNLEKLSGQLDTRSESLLKFLEKLSRQLGRTSVSLGEFEAVCNKLYQEKNLDPEEFKELVKNLKNLEQYSLEVSKILNEKIANKEELSSLLLRIKKELDPIIDNLSKVIKERNCWNTFQKLNGVYDKFKGFLDSDSPLDTEEDKQNFIGELVKILDLLADLIPEAYKTKISKFQREKDALTASSDVPKQPILKQPNDTAPQTMNDLQRLIQNKNQEQEEQEQSTIRF